MKIDWMRKLTSRKLWMALAAFVSGLIMAFGGGESLAQTVSGCILQGAAVLGYLLAEGLTDASATGSAEDLSEYVKQVQGTGVTVSKNTSIFDLNARGEEAEPEESPVSVR